MDDVAVGGVGVENNDDDYEYGYDDGYKLAILYDFIKFLRILVFFVVLEVKKHWFKASRPRQGSSHAGGFVHL